MQADVRAHLLDRERRGVRREDRVRRDLAHLGEDLALHVELLEHRLEHEVAACELLPARAAVDERREERLLAPPPRGSTRAPRRRAPARGRAARPAPRAGAGRASRAASPSARRRRCRPSARVRGFASGRLGGRFDRRSTTVNAYADACACGLDEQLGHRLLLGGVALLDRPVPRAGDQVERDVRRARRSVHRVVDARARLAQRPCRAPTSRAPLARRLDSSTRERERLVDELDRLEQPVGDAELERLLRRRAACSGAAGSATITLAAASGADEPRQELRAAPARDDREGDLGEADVANVRRRSCARRSAARARARRRGRRR